MLLFVATACLAGSSVGAVVTATEADAGKTVRVPVGGTLELRLVASPGTGFGWQVERLEPAKLTEAAPTSFENPPPDVEGSPVRQIFRWKAAEPGIVELLLHYERPWERKPPLETFSLRVHIERPRETP
jgi:predicted secreted protein